MRLTLPCSGTHFPHRDTTQQRWPKESWASIKLKGKESKEPGLLLSIIKRVLRQVLIPLKLSLLMAGAWNKGPFKVPSNPSHAGTP